MKIEIGKEYKTRNGLKVKVYDIAEKGEYPVKCGIIHADNDITLAALTKTGQYFSHREDYYDIVGEWKEPLDFDWSCLPTWINEYIAMDKSGTWYAYSMEPEKSTYGRTDHWEAGGRFTAIPKDYAPKNFKGDWEDSLFKNPNLPCEK